MHLYISRLIFLSRKKRLEKEIKKPSGLKTVLCHCYTKISTQRKFFFHFLSFVAQIGVAAPLIFLFKPSKTQFGTFSLIGCNGIRGWTVQRWWVGSNNSTLVIKKSIWARCELSNFVLFYNWNMCSNSQEGLFIILLYWVQIYRKILTGPCF